MAQRLSKRHRRKHDRIADWQQKDAGYFDRLGIPRDELSRIELAFAGKIVLPGDADYDQDRQESNPAFQAYPLIIFYCETDNDVWIALTVCRIYNLWVCVRAGGHSTAGYSVNSGAVIDVSGLSYVRVDQVNQTVSVGAGTSFDILNSALNNTGLHVPSGECGDVCVGGFVQGGGYGYTSRCFGVQSDSALAFRVMLANGGTVTANATMNSDLYWAIRGGTGGNFGVLLEVTYRLYPVASVWAYSIQWDISNAAAALFELQAHYMLTGAPKQLGATINLGFNGSTPVLLMQGMYVGSASDGKQALQSLLAIPSADLNVDISGPYGSMNTYLETHPYIIPNPPDGSKEAKRAGYIEKPLTLSDWDEIVAYAQTAPNPNNTAIIEPYGGAINVFPIADSAFIHRTAAMDFFVDVFWVNDNDEALAKLWLEGFWILMRPHLNGHVYQNYPYAELADFQNAYWGQAYPRLMQVKTKYDPTNFFHFAQSIGLTTPDPDATPIIYDLSPPQLMI